MARRLFSLPLVAEGRGEGARGVAAPHVVVRVNNELYPATRERLDQIAHARGFEGRLVVLGETDIALGDCRIEWADGGVKRDSAAIATAINAAVASYIAARRGES